MFTLATLVTIVTTAWPLIQIILTWASTELVNVGLFKKFGFADNNETAVHVVAYGFSGLLTAGFLAATHQPLTSFEGVFGALSTAIVGKFGASYIHDAITPPTVNPAAGVTVAK